jgi:oligosaccharide reducing-end xylanase
MNYYSYFVGLVRRACLLALCLGYLAGSVAAQAPAKARQPAKDGAFYTNKYPNLLREAGYRQADIDKKVAQAYHDVFEGPNKVYFAVGDSLAYVSDVKNEDARTEGLSYGMMVAVQLNKKEVFDRLWRWSKKYLQHQSGPLEGYFAWSINTATMKRNSEGPASDGELYFVTSLLFASNRWGNTTGIDYYREARRILDASWKKDGTAEVYNLFNTQHKQISFVPVGDMYNWTDPSYHVPAFLEVWAEYAKDGHEQFYRDCADTSRVFLRRACAAPAPPPPASTTTTPSLAASPTPPSGRRRRFATTPGACP